MGGRTEDAHEEAEEYADKDALRDAATEKTRRNETRPGCEEGALPLPLRTLSFQWLHPPSSLSAYSSASSCASSVRPHLLGIVTQVEAVRAVYRRYVSAVCDALTLGCLPLGGGGGSGGKGAGGGGSGAVSAAQGAAVALLEACRSGTVSLEEAVWKRWEERAACPAAGPASSSASSYFSSGMPSVSSSSLSSVWNSSSLSSSSISASSSPNASFSLGSEVTRYILVTRPLERIHYYETFLKEVLRNEEEGGRRGGAGERDHINFAYSHWRLTANYAHKMQIEAEVTRTFWDSNAGLAARLPKELFSPVRRLIRDSKMYPISLHNAGRFSSHSFILMSGVLLHIQYSSVALYPLETMWVETVPAASSVQNGIVLTMPEETLTLTCPSGPDKTQWLRALQEAVRGALLPPSPIPGAEGGGEEGVPPLRSPPLVRNATYTFTKSGPFKDATYRGQWLCGKPHGAGTLSWASSGTTYKGQFRQGLYHGVGILHTPLHPVVSSSSASSSSHSSSGSASTTSSSGYSSSYFTSSGSSGSHTSYPTSMSSSSSSSSSFVVMQEGMWISGKMVGQAVIRYANGDLYVGQVKDGLPSGHGVRKTGHFGSQAASVYTGEGSQGVRAGFWGLGRHCQRLGVLIYMAFVLKGRDVHSTLAPCLVSSEKILSNTVVHIEWVQVMNSISGCDRAVYEISVVPHGSGADPSSENSSFSRTLLGPQKMRISGSWYQPLQLASLDMVQRYGSPTRQPNGPQFALWELFKRVTLKSPLPYTRGQGP
ncbi:uncharacterized protein LOC119596701 [Penaeus monodon]|uniref:uncharacterized protein LOC119596701 n=1 Tax=Penaeus monodon TaxID=6687 RepID=UPI0018A746E5|nr:uncharacterized protein LOC119596701 [Penaeus monodon]